MGECREEVYHEVPKTNAEKMLKIMKNNFLEKKRVFVENRRTPDFKELRKAIFTRDKADRKMRRDAAPGAKFVDEIIPADLKEEWEVARDAFIKRFYYWEGFGRITPWIVSLHTWITGKFLSSRRFWSWQLMCT